MLKEFDKPQIVELLSPFSCPRNPDVERFLTDSAIRFEESDNARTYLILDDAGEILGYFSLSFKEISLLGTEISKSQIKRLDGISKSAERVRAYLIGQLAKNSALDSNPLTLEEILLEVYKVIDAARSLVGGRAIILECEDSEKLISLYQSHGFSRLTKDDNGGLVTMYTYIQKIV